MAFYGRQLENIRNAKWTMLNQVTYFLIALKQNSVCKITSWCSCLPQNQSHATPCDLLFLKGNVHLQPTYTGSLSMSLYMHLQPHINHFPISFRVVHPDSGPRNRSWPLQRHFHCVHCLFLAQAPGRPRKIWDPQHLQFVQIESAYTWVDSKIQYDHI